MAQKGRHKKGQPVDDEYYTLYEDIEKELVYFKEELRDKNIYLMCDDPRHSNFYKYLTDHYKEYKIRSIIATCYNSNKVIKTTEDRTTITKVKDFKGDFREKTAQDLMKESDIIITNPPFSLFRVFLLDLLNSQKDFLIIGPLSTISHKEIFSYWQAGIFRTGYSKPKRFIQPNKEIRVFGNCCWYTTFEIKTSKEKLPTIPYEQEKYNKYVNLDAIDIPRLKDIPEGYTGKMGVPLTYIFHHNPKEYEVLGISRLSEDVKPVGKEWCDLYKSQGGKAHISPNMRVLVLIDKEGKAKNVFQRIIIQKINYKLERI